MSWLQRGTVVTGRWAKRVYGALRYHQPDSLLSRVLRPAAARAGIRKHIGWHTFRHTFSTVLMANGENVKVVQELMRHANCRCTLEIYSQARIQAKREAQRRVVEMIISREQEVTDLEEPLILAKN